MRFIKYFKFLIIFVLLLNCKKDNEINKKIILKENEIVNKKVIVIGRSDDSLSFKYFNLLNYSYFFGKPHEDRDMKVSNDSLIFTLDSIREPQLMDLWLPGENNMIYRARLYIRPGDTITFKIEKEKLLFTGKNSVENNFYTQLFGQDLSLGKVQYKNNIYEYKSQIKDIYDKKNKFLKDYKTQHKFISEGFIEAAEANLKFEYLSCLIQPRYILSKGSGLYLIGGNGVINAVQNREKRNEKLFDAQKYLDNITIEDFKKPELLNNYFFKEAITDFIRYYFVSNKYIDFSKEKFLAEKRFIQKNFNDDLEYYAIARMIREYDMRGFGYSRENIDILKKTINEYDSIFSIKPSYKEKMDEIKESLDNFNFKLSNGALNLTKLINPIGDTVTLQQIFNKTPHKIKVIDFWASWCPPCIREIKKAKHFKNRLSDKENVEWIYLSIDKDQMKWLKSTNGLQEYLNTEHQYIVIGGKNSSLGRSLKVSGIPRYVIFDKKEEIVLDNAPRPSDSLIFKKIIDKINKETN